MRARQRKPRLWEVVAMLVTLGAAVYLIATSCAGPRRLLTTTEVGYSKADGGYGRGGRQADIDSQSAWISVRPFSLFWEDEVHVSNFRAWREMAMEAERAEGSARKPSSEEEDEPPTHVPWWRTTAGVTAVLASIGAIVGMVFGGRHAHNRGWLKRKNGEEAEAPSP